MGLDLCCRVIHRRQCLGCGDRYCVHIPSDWLARDDSVKATEIIRPWVKAGATWWIESMWGDSDAEHIRTRLQHPPPRI